MDGGGWCLRHSSYGGRAPKGVDQISGAGFHTPQVATIAISMQGKTCDIGNCYDREFDFDAAMDGEGIRALLKERGTKQKDAAEVLGLTPDKFSKVLKGTRKLTAAETDLLRRFLGVTDPAALPPSRRLPIVGLVAAGAWREGFESVIGWMPSPDAGLSEDAFVVRVSGNSMDLIAREGEDIIVEPRDRHLVAGKLYVIRNSEGETTFKRYMEAPARLEPCSTSDEHKAIYLGEEPIEVIGRVRKKVTDL
jgi:SOS-response transcriptional repressor LexA